MILIVDDDPNIIKSLTRSVMDSGFTVTSASNGVDAFRLLSLPECSAMLLDIKMPHLDGMDLLTLMKREKIEIPTIIISGVEDLDEEALMAFPAVVAIYRKPFKTHELIETLKKSIENKLRVIIMTSHYRITGKLDILAPRLLEQFVKETGTFLSVTDAEIADRSGKTCYKISRIEVRVDEIQIISPMKNVIQMPGVFSGNTPCFNA